MLVRESMQAKAVPRFYIRGLMGFGVYTALLLFAAWQLPAEAFQPASKQFILVAGALAAWRYSWGLLHFIRSFIYRKRVFPRLRAMALRDEPTLLPPHVYLLITSFRIDAETSI